MNKTREFNLSNKIYEDFSGGYKVKLEDVKEFIRLLQEVIISKKDYGLIINTKLNNILKEIDKLAGDKLGEDKK